MKTWFSVICDWNWWHIHILKGDISLCVFRGLWILDVFTVKVEIDENKMHFCHLILFYFQKRKTLLTIKKDMVSYLRVLFIKWFTKFRSETFDLENWKHSSRPTVIDDEQIKRKIKTNPGHTIWIIKEIVRILCISIL